MKEVDIAAVRAELEGFVEDVFGSLPRADQRAKGSLYLRGLMLDGKRKSMQPMAARLGVDFQQLQQFVSSSPWRIEPVRRAIAALATETIIPEVWVIDDTGFKKDGASSPGVARQYSGTIPAPTPMTTRCGSRPDGNAPDCPPRPGIKRNGPWAWR